jgi:hypothetical protein
LALEREPNSILERYPHQLRQWNEDRLKRLVLLVADTNWWIPKLLALGVPMILILGESVPVPLFLFH